MRLITSLLALAAAAMAQQADPQANTITNNYFLGTTPAQRYEVNQTQAQQIINAARDEAAKINVPMNIAVVNYYSSLVAFLHMDNSYPGSIDISIKKAKTVVVFNGQVPNAGYYNASQPGGSLYAIEQTNGGLVVFGGGLPLVFNGILYGAVGVSGGSVPQDIQVATAGVRAVGGYIAPSS